MKKLKALFLKLVNRETITYVVFGALTTLVNLLVFKLFDVIFAGRLYLLTNTIAWITAVSFAFLTNKWFVFESKAWTWRVLRKEIPGFFGARIASYFIEQGGLWFFVEILHFDEKVFNFLIVKLSGKIVAKLIIGVLVIVVNYLFSKFVIFRKKKQRAAETEENEKNQKSV